MKGLRLSITFISLFVLSLFLVVGKVNAFNPTQYQYKIGTAPVAGPVVSMAFNGDRVELTGSGNFTLTPKSVTGGGTFVHKNVNGTVIGSGTWMATRLWSFSSYGTQTGLPSNFEGGHALIGVHLMPTG
ncbi:hypothetical protein HYS11_01075, partial [Candidatus Gottesmanbacteria bacterium]|nr:hypothetical protein [Candidatus Gottesmanbacteria bacterium]